MLMFRIVVLCLLLVSYTVAQTFNGPAEGNVSSGMVISTDNFSRATSLPQPVERGIRNVAKPDYDISGLLRLTNTQEGDNYFTDPAVEAESNLLMYDTVSSVLLKTFSGMLQTNSIPPDPYMAVGPEHIMTVVNSNFSIWDKEGNLIKEINAGSWYRNLLSSASPFDPKVLYDHFDKRWIMVWLDQDDAAQRGIFFVSVSDDSIPTGTWYNWSLPSNQNGNTFVTNWGDYQGVGYDKNAIYITANQFSFGSSYQYVKIRIVPKADLYANNAGEVKWTDFWNIGYPAGNTLPYKVFNIRPTIMYDDNSDYYLLHSPNHSVDYFALYKISNPTTNPVLTGSLVPVNYYNPAPNANQLGGGPRLLEAGGSNLRNEPKVRDGYIHAAHSINNPQGGSSVRYVKINASTSQAVEDMSMGAPNYWYSYPAIEVDKDHNVAISYSRSATTEYIGAYYTYRAAGDAPGLRGSLTLQAGKGNYQKDYGSGRNRWGDYNGIWLDPSDNYSMWMFTEYAEVNNTWGTWVGKIRLTPFEGSFPFASASLLDFGNVEINTSSDTLVLYISNYGEENLVVEDIPEDYGAFSLVESVSYPYTLGTYDSLRISFVFHPIDTGAVDIVYPFDTDFSGFNGIRLKGYGYKIVPAEENIFYAATGTLNNSISLTLDKISGTASVLGPSRMTEIRSLATHPVTGVIYGVNNEEQIVRYNAEKGDAYKLFGTDKKDLYALAFNNTGDLYAAQKSGEIYLVDLDAQTLTEVSKAQINIYDISFNPQDNELYASIFLAIGSGKDRIFKIDLNTGDTTLIGQTGFGTPVPAIAFDGSGSLYGISGNSNQVNNLISIDKNTGAGTVISTTGIKHITALTYGTDNLVSAGNENTQLPSAFELKQNYPNPFNPSTVIEYSLPEASNVKLTIYNLLGETVGVLVNSDQVPGVHKVEWNSSAKNISSGIYFYEIKAKGNSGKDFSLIRKMILMK
jgi:hypothetical protein